MQSTRNRLSHLSGELRGSEILRIFGEIRELVAKGHDILDLTIGDFSPAEFPIPAALQHELLEALKKGETNYPPGIGMPALRTAIQKLCAERLDLKLSLDEIMVTSGSRPAIYALYRALVDPGDKVVFGVPSWNNEYYCSLVGAQPVAIECSRETDFLLTADLVRDHVRGARLLALNSPMNPTGTLFNDNALAAICDLVLDENTRRGANERPLYLFFDQVYWMLTIGKSHHVHPLLLRPELAPYTILVDGISKGLAATGLRVGWSVAPADLTKAMNNINTHLGAWAPRAEQVATARFLGKPGALDEHLHDMRAGLADRLDAMYEGLSRMKADGLPVDCIKPKGAIYISARFKLTGSRTPAGATLHTDDDVRNYLLTEAGLAVVPFGAFGAKHGDGWFRLSIGVASVAKINALMPRLRAAIEATRSGAPAHERLAAGSAHS